MWLERLSMLIFWLIVVFFAIFVCLCLVGIFAVAVRDLRARMKDITNARLHREGKYPPCTATNAGQICVLHKDHLEDTHAGNWRTNQLGGEEYRVRWMIVKGGNSVASWTQSKEATIGKKVTQ